MFAATDSEVQNLRCKNECSYWQAYEGESAWMFDFLDSQLGGAQLMLWSIQWNTRVRVIPAECISLANATRIRVMNLTDRVLHR
jgi:hypothetical protein